MKQPIKLGRLFSKRTLKVILSWLVLAVIIAGVVFLAVKLGEYVEADTKTIHPAWARGGLDEDGNYVSGKTSIYTEKAFDCNGLVVTLDFDANVKYQLYFYDDNGELCETESSIEAVTDAQTGRFEIHTTGTDKNAPSTASFCRIVVTPLEDNSIGFLEIAKYSKQITIEVAK